MSSVLFPAVSHKRPDAEGVLSTWFVADGATVDTDQLIAEVQVDKVSVEVAAPCAGVITLLVKEGEPITQGTPIANIA